MVLDLDVKINPAKLGAFNEAMKEAATKEERDGQNEANERARREAEAMRRREDAQRAENRLAWAEHCEAMYRSHARLAASYAARAVSLLEEGKGAGPA